MHAAQKKVLVVGSGRVGRTIAHMLVNEPSYVARYGARSLTDTSLACRYKVRISDVAPKKAAAVRDQLLNPEAGVKVLCRDG